MSGPKARRQQPVAPSLPFRVTTRDGLAFNPSSDVWPLWSASRQVSFTFHSLQRTAPALLPALKATLCWYAKERSVDTARNALSRLTEFCGATSAAQNLPVHEVSAQALINYRASLEPRRAWLMASLGGVIKRWHQLRYPGIAEDAIKYLRSVRLKGNQKGAAVLTMDPRTGPFTDLELEAIQASLNTSYGRNEISTADFLATWLFMLLGARPIQVAALKVCDVRVAVASDRRRAYTLHVPRAKQRFQGIRVQQKLRALNPQVGELLAEHAASVRRRFRSRLSDPSLAPLFPSARPLRTAPGFQWHLTGEALSKRIGSALSRVAARSERTGEILAITPVRFRRTLGTRAAAEGHGERVIAELLDHSDLQSVGVYTAMRPELLRRIDKALALELAPLAQAFAGTVVASAPSPEGRITDPRFDATMRRPMGSCGHKGTCGLLAPLACYTCASFRPWIRGPHAAVLDYLLAERERLLAATDMRIASINDRTLLAVADVLRRCDAHGSLLADGKRHG